MAATGIMTALTAQAAATARSHSAKPGASTGDGNPAHAAGFLRRGQIFDFVNYLADHAAWPQRFPGKSRADAPLP
jgi:hypothetical protein